VLREEGTMNGGKRGPLIVLLIFFGRKGKKQKERALGQSNRMVTVVN